MYLIHWCNGFGHIFFSKKEITCTRCGHVLKATISAVLYMLTEAKVVIVVISPELARSLIISQNVRREVRHRKGVIVDQLFALKDMIWSLETLS